MRSKAPLLALLVLIVSPSLAQPAASFPTCLNIDLRALNGGGGTPCAVANTILGGMKLDPNMPALPPAQGYGPPSEGEFPFASETMCTTEMYNLVQGCAACQQASTPIAEQLKFPSLPEWNRRCTEIGIQTNNADFSSFLANGVIPAWSRTPPSIDDTFNVKNLISTLPAAPIPGVTLSFSPTSPPISAATQTTEPVGASSVSVESPNSTPVGPIIGGVVGGVVFLLLIGGLIFWFCRRKRSRSHLAPSAEFMNARHIPLAQEDEDDDREMSAPMRQRHSMVSDPPPAFTPGQFKDPIFEKGVAISTGAMAMSNVGHSAATSYSPVTPSSAQQGPIRQSSGDQYPSPLRQSSADQYPSSLRQSSADQYQSSADAYQTSASHQYHSSVDQYHSSVDQYRTDVQPHSPHSPEMAHEMPQGYRD